jgi:hypothetical protein
MREVCIQSFGMKNLIPLGPLGRPRYRWANIIKMDLRETGLGGADGIHLAWDRDQWWALVNTIVNIHDP